MKRVRGDEPEASAVVNVDRADGEGPVVVDVAEAGSSSGTRAALRRAVTVEGSAQPAVVAVADEAKGDVLAVARLAGIMAAKRTADLIPLCHPLMLSKVAVDLTPAAPDAVEIEATVALTGRTGVEMEALTAVTVAALTVYDMCKALDRGMWSEAVRLSHKSGGKSGSYEAP